MYFNAISIYRVGNFFFKKKVPFLPRLFEALTYLLTNCSIPVDVDVGEGTYYGHCGIGVVIHPGAKIGWNCVLRAHVVLGGKGGGLEGAPVLGDHIEIGAGAKILGPVKIGNNAVIGANAVVLCDVPAGDMAIGVPAQIVHKSDWGKSSI